MTDLENAVQLLDSTGATCVLCRGELTYTSHKTGISPMLDFLEAGTDLSGFSAADKIIGKAAALLFIKAGVCAVHGSVMSREGLATLTRYGITATYDELTDMIVNRTGTGSCPMEATVVGIDSPEEAETALRKKREELRR